MSRISIPTLESAPSASKPLLDGVHKKLGVIPNVFRLAALSPAALEGFLGLSGALSKTLDVRTRERIAIAVAEVNGCDYCLSAHTYLALNLAKISPEDAELARKGSSTDPKAGACDTLYQITSDPRLNHRAGVVRGVLAERCAAVLTRFFAAKRKLGKG